MNPSIGTGMFPQLFQLSRNEIFEVIARQIFRPLWCSRRVCSDNLGEKCGTFFDDVRIAFLTVFNAGYIGPHSIVHETEFALAALESQVVVWVIFFYSTMCIVDII